MWSRISQMCLLNQSNSGDTLKLLILNQIRKYLSDFSNNLNKVINQWMKETKMGNRGSKSSVGTDRKGDHISESVCTIVKEQRIDGGCMELKDSILRCNLMDLERDYQIRIPSKYKKKEIRYYSTSSQVDSQAKNINPWFLTGFIDAEGCFRISLTKVNNALGWRVQLFFQINLQARDKDLLENIKNYLEVGQIHISGKNLLQHRIQTIDELAVLIKHLKNFQLLTQKRGDFLLFKQAYELVINKEHLTKEGILKIVSLKASLNRGLSEQLKAAFPDNNPAIRLTDFSINIPDCLWLSGFASGEACFLVGTAKCKGYTTGY